MWVSKKEMDALLKRLRDLEDWKRYDSSHHDFTVFKQQKPETYGGILFPNYGGYTPPPSKTISVKDVVERICDRLGLELVYEEGTPAKVEMKKKAKAA